jgi:hypothetical protein
MLHDDEYGTQATQDIKETEPMMLGQCGWG